MIDLEVTAKHLSSQSTVTPWLTLWARRVSRGRGLSSEATSCPVVQQGPWPNSEGVRSVGRFTGDWDGLR